MTDFMIDDFNTLRAALQEMCRRLLCEQVPEERVFDSKLVANELLSNVLQHGGGRAHLTASKENGEIRITVKEESGYRPPEQSTLADVYSERGRGLYLVDAYCCRREYDEQKGICVYIKL